MAKASWKLCTYGANNAKGRAGIAIGNDVHDAEKLTKNKAYASVLAILEDWGKAERAINAAAAKATTPLTGAKRLATKRAPKAAMTLLEASVGLEKKL